jgi:hypothetical protein
MYLLQKKLFSVSIILVHFVLLYRIPKTGKFIRNRNLFLTVVEAGKPKTSGPASGKGFLTASSYVRRQKGKRREGAHRSHFSVYFQFFNWYITYTEKRACVHLNELSPTEHSSVANTQIDKQNGHHPKIPPPLSPSHS